MTNIQHNTLTSMAITWLKRHEYILYTLSLTLCSNRWVCFSAPSCRGLRFIQVLLQSLADGDRDENNPNLIRVNITKAYEHALKRYHGWIVQKVFSVSRRSTWKKSVIWKLPRNVLLVLCYSCIIISCIQNITLSTSLLVLIYMFIKS